MATPKRLKFTEYTESNLLRLDLGAGKGLNTPDGFIGVDMCRWEGIQEVDLRKPWPWKTSTVDEAQANYVIQYLTATERIHFANELYRVLKPGAKALILTPYWAAGRAYGDPLIQWPPVSEAWYQVLDKNWRETQNYVDRTGYECDFESTMGYGLHPMIVARNMEYQQHAVTFWKEAAQDLIGTVTARK